MTMRNLFAFLFGFLLWSTAASAQTIIGTLPFTLQNGSVADANQVMSDFNTIVSAVNSNAASAGVNSNITALNGLITPLSYTAGGSSFYIGGTSSGSANAYVVASPVPTGFTLVTGKVVSFIANFANTGATQINVNGTGLTNFFRQTTSGPAAMVGGEVQLNQVVFAYYDGTQFECLNCAQTALVPSGTIADFAGVTVPAGWALANGAALSRATNPLTFSALAFTSVSATTNSNTTVNITGANTFIQVGWFVGGNNVTCNSTVTAVAANSITISATAGATGATTLSIGPYPQGDCSTTFNLPNFTGRVAAGVDGATNITTTTCTNPGTLGATCGAQAPNLAQNALPNVVPTFTGTASGQVFVQNTSNVTFQDGSSSLGTAFGPSPPLAAVSAPAGTISSINGNVTQQGYNNLQPTGLVYKIVKL